MAKILLEISQGNAVLCVPKEVIRELKIQSHSLPPNENQRISDLLEHCQEVLPDLVNIEVEHKIREMSAYVRSKFTSVVKGRKMDYPAIGDCRILHASYYSDSVLITSNIKDFLLYPLLFNDQDRLYDLLNQTFVHIPKQVYENIHSDLYFKALLYEFHELNQDIEDNNL